MVKEIQFKLKPSDLNDKEKINSKIRKMVPMKSQSEIRYEILRKSIDARGPEPLYVIKLKVYIDEEIPERESVFPTIRRISGEQEAIIIGAGPAGYFAALQLIELGIKPILFERGKDVQSRRKDLRQIQQFSTVNPDSNYCFGEGGAGTYSDGKLYTRAKKRGDVQRILRMLVELGASSDIEIDAHPHIGSNKLPKIIANLRAHIQSLGGEIHFNHCLYDLIIEDNQLTGAKINQREHFTQAIILATGHSARDIYYMLQRQQLLLTFKDFALGVRIEHPQSLIDEIQYNMSSRSEHLPAAAYRLACQVGEKGVFSFCMCPGGMIVPTATNPGEIVLNGMSLSKRNSPFANAGVVTSIDKLDLKSKDNPFTGLEFQRKIERDLFNHGDGSQKAPAQRLPDFISGKLSNNLNESSYIPGVYSAPVHELLPYFIVRRLRNGVHMFNKRMKGYLTSEANVLAVESRTSSPIRIPRDIRTMMHPQLPGLFPCGEGGGYAGGIMSAALDGQRVAVAVANYLGE